MMEAEGLFVVSGSGYEYCRVRLFIRSDGRSMVVSVQGHGIRDQGYVCETSILIEASSSSVISVEYNLR